jgi:hypothetical protein
MALHTLTLRCVGAGLLLLQQTRPCISRRSLLPAQPDNLILDFPDGTLRLCDFGHAYVGGSPLEANIRGTRGTPGYMAPEIFDWQPVVGGTCSRPYCGSSADVWSAGVVLFNMLTGLPPMNVAVRGDTYWFDKLARGDYAGFWASHEPYLPLPKPTMEARDLINHMLCVKPAERWTIDECLRSNFFKSGRVLLPAELREEFQRRYAAVFRPAAHVGALAPQGIQAITVATAAVTAAIVAGAEAERAAAVAAAAVATMDRHLGAVPSPVPAAVAAAAPAHALPAAAAAVANEVQPLPRDASCSRATCALPASTVDFFSSSSAVRSSVDMRSAHPAELPAAPPGFSGPCRRPAPEEERAEMRILRDIFRDVASGAQVCVCPSARVHFFHV